MPAKTLSLLFVFLCALPSAASNIKTPFLKGWKQTQPAQLERQAKKYPETFIMAGDPNKKAVALTYDDGPSVHTLELLKVLDKHDVKATFFWMGERMIENPAVVEATQKAGHTIANHTFSHDRSSELTDIVFMETQVERTQYVFQNILGYRPRLFRPPYGDIRDKQIELLAQKGMQLLGWTINTDDWLHNTRPEGVETILNVVKAYLHPGAIVMMHDGGGDRSKTVSATDLMIPYLKEKGYEILTADKLLGLDPVLYPTKSDRCASLSCLESVSR